MSATTGQLSKLFITNLSPSVTPDDLRKVFEKFGRVSECLINKKDDAPEKVFAFVKLDSHAIAAKAKDALDQTTLLGRNMRIKWALPQSVLTVHDLEMFVSNEMLAEAFSQFGQVESAVVATDPLTKKSKGYGFITFVSRGSARKAQTQCSEGLYLLGPTWRPVRVEAAQFDEQEEGLRDKNQGVECNPRFAKPGSMEYEFAMKWRELTTAQKKEEEVFKDKHASQSQQMRKLQDDAMWVEEQEVQQRRIDQRQRRDMGPPSYDQYPPPMPPPMSGYPPHPYPGYDAYGPPPNYPPPPGNYPPHHNYSAPPNYPPPSNYHPSASNSYSQPLLPAPPPPYPTHSLLPPHMSHSSHSSSYSQGPPPPSSRHNPPNHNYHDNHSGGAMRGNRYDESRGSQNRPSRYEDGRGRGSDGGHYQNQNIDSRLQQGHRSAPYNKHR